MRVKVVFHAVRFRKHISESDVEIKANECNNTRKLFPLRQAARSTVRTLQAYYHVHKST